MQCTSRGTPEATPRRLLDVSEARRRAKALKLRVLAHPCVHDLPATRAALVLRLSFQRVNKTKTRIVASAAVVLIVLFAAGQRACDRAGYWPHSEETRVYAGAAWPADEERKCSALPHEDGTIFFLGCVDSIQNFDEATPLKVTFWGRTQREDRFQALHSEAMEGWRWRCRKSGESVTCYAVN